MNKNFQDSIMGIEEKVNMTLKTLHSMSESGEETEKILKRIFESKLPKVATDMKQLLINYTEL